jgi:hypothetical protein
MLSPNKNYDVIGFLMTGPKSRDDFWESEDFYVNELGRGICPYKMLNDLVEWGHVEKIGWKFDNDWTYHKVKWKLNNDFLEDQKDLEVTTVKREEKIDETTVKEIFKLKKIESRGRRKFSSQETDKMVAMAENRKLMDLMVERIKKMNKYGVDYYE